MGHAGENGGGLWRFGGGGGEVKSLSQSVLAGEDVCLEETDRCRPGGPVV